MCMHKVESQRRMCCAAPEDDEEDGRGSEGLLSGAVVLERVCCVRSRFGAGDGVFALFRRCVRRFFLLVDALAAAEWAGVPTLGEPLWSLVSKIAR